MRLFVGLFMRTHHFLKTLATEAVHLVQVIGSPVVVVLAAVPGAGACGGPGGALEKRNCTGKTYCMYSV